MNLIYLAELLHTVQVYIDLKGEEDFADEIWL
jgi:hypothetical protein